MKFLISIPITIFYGLWTLFRLPLEIILDIIAMHESEPTTSYVHELISLQTLVTPIFK